MLERRLNSDPFPCMSRFDEGPVDVRNGRMEKKAPAVERQGSDQPRPRAQTMFASLGQWLRESNAEPEVRRKSEPASLPSAEPKEERNKEDREIHWMGLVRWFE